MQDEKFAVYVNYIIDFNLVKDITSENGHWFIYALLKKKKQKNTTVYKHASVTQA